MSRTYDTDLITSELPTDTESILYEPAASSEPLNTTLIASEPSPVVESAIFVTVRAGVESLTVTVAFARNFFVVPSTL